MKTDRRTFLAALPGAFATATLTSLASREAEGESASPRLPNGAVSRFVQANGIRMHYVRAGSGPLIVLLHGWPQTWFSWQHVVSRLAAAHTVVVPDLRGCGLTERPEGGYDKRTIGEDVRALITAIGFDRAMVVGHDMGGKAAYVLAHLHPGVVSKLALVDCLVPGTENMDALRGGAWHYGFHMAAGFPEMLTKGREREYISAQIKAWSYRKDAVTDLAIDEYARHYAAPGGMTAGFNYYRALRQDAELAATLHGKPLAMPVLAIAGRHSVGDRLGEALTKETGRLTSVVVEDCGHFVAEERPEEFIGHLERFAAS